MANRINLLLLVLISVSVGDGRYTDRYASATANLIPGRVVFFNATAEHFAGQLLY